MRRLRLGMVGGGQGAFIGAVHRIASRIDGRFDVVAGALASDPARAHASAAELGIAPDRSYGDFRVMAAAEAAREDGIVAVSIVTPNHMHGPIAEAFLAQGIHVICDKPMTATLEQAMTLASAAQASDAHFFLTHNYTGYPMIRQAREMVADGTLGDIRCVQAEYLQDWLGSPAEPDNKQAAWRTDPAQAGGGAIGDIGTHAYNLACFVTGEVPSKLSANLRSCVEGRKVDDDARVQLAYANGADGHIWASQVAAGNENALTLRVYGSKGGISWAQENPNVLSYAPLGAPVQTLTRSGHGARGVANAVSRIPGGHPEGYLEAFATLYSEAADIISGAVPWADHTIGLQHGLDGMIFIDACQRSSAASGEWMDLS